MFDIIVEGVYIIERKMYRKDFVIIIRSLWKVYIITQYQISATIKNVLNKLHFFLIHKQLDKSM